jgi:large subunit ribosomal protein L10
MASVAPHKKEIVEKVTKLLKEYPVTALVDVESLPAPQFQAMREKLRGDVVIFMTKKRFIKIAFENAKGDKKDIDKLGDYFRGMPTLICTKMSPFKLFAQLKKSKSEAPAKAGQIAPKDIVVPAGPTGFSPGPVIGELGALGIKSKVDGGKISILQDTTVCKDGDVISEALASMLTRLNINPMEVGLAITAVYEDGVVYTKDVLDVDEDQYREDFTSAAAWALNLAVDIGYATTDTINVLLGKAQREAYTLGMEAAIVSKDNVEDLIARGAAQADGLKSAVKL